VRLLLKGVCMGAADVVPGVSGGTMAFILGIYEELIQAIRSFDLVFFKDLLALKFKDAFEHVSWPFLGALGSGILLAIFTLARALSWLLTNRPVLIWSFFFGLVFASVFIVNRKVKRWSAGLVVGILMAAVGTYFLVGMVPMSTPEAPWFLFLSGALAICAMILPGISGAFILLLLGKYQYVLDAVNHRDLMTLGLVAAGAVVGLMSFSRVLGWLFRRYHDLTIAVLSGLMIGSLRKVWPWKKTLISMTDRHGQSIPLSQANILPSQWDQEVWLALALALLGFVAVWVLNALAERKDPA
jgi:putative membrane protein